MKNKKEKNQPVIFKTEREAEFNKEKDKDKKKSAILSFFLKYFVLPFTSPALPLLHKVLYDEGEQTKLQERISNMNALRFVLEYPLLIVPYALELAENNKAEDKEFLEHAYTHYPHEEYFRTIAEPQIKFLYGFVGLLQKGIVSKNFNQMIREFISKGFIFKQDEPVSWWVYADILLCAITYYYSNSLKQLNKNESQKRKELLAEYKDLFDLLTKNGATVNTESFFNYLVKPVKKCGYLGLNMEDFITFKEAKHKDSMIVSLIFSLVAPYVVAVENGAKEIARFLAQKGACLNYKPHFYYMRIYRVENLGKNMHRYLSAEYRDLISTVNYAEEQKLAKVFIDTVVECNDKKASPYKIEYIRAFVKLLYTGISSKNFNQMIQEFFSNNKYFAFKQKDPISWRAYADIMLCTITYYYCSSLKQLNKNEQQKREDLLGEYEYLFDLLIKNGATVNTETFFDNVIKPSAKSGNVGLNIEGFVNFKETKHKDLGNTSLLFSLVAPYVVAEESGVEEIRNFLKEKGAKLNYESHSYYEPFYSVKNLGKNMSRYLSVGNKNLVFTPVPKTLRLAKTFTDIVVECGDKSEIEFSNNLLM